MNRIIFLFIFVFAVSVVLSQNSSNLVFEGKVSTDISKAGLGWCYIENAAAFEIHYLTDGNFAYSEIKMGWRLIDEKYSLYVYPLYLDMRFRKAKYTESLVPIIEYRVPTSLYLCRRFNSNVELSFESLLFISNAPKIRFSIGLRWLYPLKVN